MKWALALSFLVASAPAVAMEDWRLVSDNGRMGLLIDLSSIKKTPLGFEVDKITVDNTESAGASIARVVLEIKCPGHARHKASKGGKAQTFTSSTTAKALCRNPKGLQWFGGSIQKAAHTYRALTAFPSQDPASGEATLAQLISGAATIAKNDPTCANAGVFSHLEKAKVHAAAVHKEPSQRLKEQHYRLARREVWQAMRPVEACWIGTAALAEL